MGGRLLIVDDNEDVLRTTQRLVGPGWAVRTATNAAGARTQLAMNPNWSGFLLDVTLFEDTYGGIDLLREVRTGWPLVPAMLVTGTLERKVINEAALLGAGVIVKPAGQQELALFLERAKKSAQMSKHAGRVAVAARRTFDLDAGEAHIIWWVAAGNGVESFGAHSGIPQETVRAMVNKLLKKADAPTVGAIVTRTVCQVSLDA